MDIVNDVPKDTSELQTENGVSESLTNGNNSEPTEPTMNGNTEEESPSEVAPSEKSSSEVEKSCTEIPTEKPSESEAAQEAPKESPKVEEKVDQIQSNEEIKEHQSKEPPAPPSRKRKAEEEPCPEQGCDFKSWYEEDMKFHIKNTHGFKQRIYKCGNCKWTCGNKWEMDFHCRGRGHKVLKEECIPCKKCDFLAETKDDAMAHKKVHIPADKLFECAGCVYVSDRLDNLRYHVNSAEHPMKTDYEKIAEEKAMANGPAALSHYKKKYNRDVKKAKAAKK